MSKVGTSYPVESRNPEKLSQRVKKDLTWIVIGVAAAMAAAAVAFTMLPR